MVVFSLVVGRKATSTIKAVNRMASLAHHDHHASEMRRDVNMYKEESARVRRLSFLLVFCTDGYVGRSGKSGGVYFVFCIGWIFYLWNLFRT